MDGKDGNGLKFEKIGQFFKLWCYVFKKSSRNSLWLALSDNIHRVSSTLGVQKYRNIGLNNLKI